MAKYKRQSKSQALAKVGLAALAKVAKTYTKARVQKYATQSMQPLTGQFDFKTDYAKRRKTSKQKKQSKKRRKWARSVIKVVRNANVGTTHIVKNSKATLSTAAGFSNAIGYGLYGLNGTAGDAFNTCNDIGEFIKEKDAAAWNNYNSTSLTIYQQSKLWVMHATMEMTIRNTDPNNDAIVEAYFIRGTRPLESAWLSPTDCYSRGLLRQSRAQDPDTGALYDQALDFKQIGVTPFQSQIFCRHFNIYKRQKFRIPPGNEVNFVIHSARPHGFATSDTYNFATDRRYHGIVFQQQGSPDASTTAQSTSVTYLSVRRYRAKFIPSNFVQGTFEVTDP